MTSSAGICANGPILVYHLSSMTRDNQRLLYYGQLQKRNGAVAKKKIA